MMNGRIEISSDGHALVLVASMLYLVVRPSLLIVAMIELTWFAPTKPDRVTVATGRLGLREVDVVWTEGLTVTRRDLAFGSNCVVSDCSRRGRARTGPGDQS